jgi:hypothetical protein
MAASAAAEVDGVEVALEDLLLGELPLQLEAEERLLRLARERALLREVEDLDVLLGDRRGALGGVGAGVAPRGPDDALQVQPVVAVERPVLGGDDGLLHVLRHVRQRHRLAVLDRELAERGLAVGVEDLRRLGPELRVGVGDVDRGVGDEERGHPGDDRQHRGDAGPLQEASPPRPGLLLRLRGSPLAGPLGSRIRRLVAVGHLNSVPTPDTEPANPGA